MFQKKRGFKIEKEVAVPMAERPWESQESQSGVMHTIVIGSYSWAYYPENNLGI